MMTCPKCGSDSITGPKYVVRAIKGEALRYICRGCGFVKDGPTRDAKP